MNINFLVGIVLMPFTAAFQSEYPYLKTPWVLYCLGVLFTGFMQLRLQQYIRNPANAVADPHALHHPELDLWRPLAPVSAFILRLLLIAAFNWPSRFSLLLIWPPMWLYNRRY